MWSHLDLHLEAVIEGSPEDEVTRRPNQKLLPLPLRHCSDGSVLIRHLEINM